jgi:hypothetical protein
MSTECGVCGGPHILSTTRTSYVYIPVTVNKSV